MNMKGISKHMLIGVTIPVAFIINAFLIPEPYSHPLIYVGLAPSKLMPFLENRELMRHATEFVFGRMTPNFAPIQIIFLIIFWFLLSMLSSISVAHLKMVRKNS